MDNAKKKLQSAVYGAHITLVLPEGPRIEIEEFYIRRSYMGILAGLPDAESTDRRR